MEPFLIGIVVAAIVIVAVAAFAVRRVRTQRRLAMEAELIAAAEPRMASRLELIRRGGASAPEEEPAPPPLVVVGEELPDHELAGAYDRAYLDETAAAETARLPEAYGVERDPFALPELEAVPEVETRFLALDDEETPADEEAGQPSAVDGEAIDSEAALEAEREAEREAAEVAAATAGESGLPLATRMGDLRERRRRLRLISAPRRPGVTERMRRTRALSADAVETRRRFRRDTIAAAVIFVALAAASFVVPRVQPLPAAPAATAAPSGDSGGAAPAGRASPHPNGE